MADDDRIADLRMARDRLLERLNDPDTPASALASVSAELRRVWAELGDVPSEEVSALDEIAARRAARIAADPAPSSRRSQPRRSGRGAGVAVGGGDDA